MELSAANHRFWLLGVFVILITLHELFDTPVMIYGVLLETFKVHDMVIEQS